MALGQHVEAALGAPLDSDVAESLATLSQYYIPTRYPDATPSGNPGAHYTARHAATAVEHAERIRAFVADQWRRLVEASGR
jgi:HEPN domain-containing protein